MDITDISDMDLEADARYALHMAQAYESLAVGGNCGFEDAAAEYREQYGLICDEMERRKGLTAS